MQSYAKNIKIELSCFGFRWESKVENKGITYLKQGDTPSLWNLLKDDFQNMICGPLARELIERKVVERMILKRILRMPWSLSCSWGSGGGTSHSLKWNETTRETIQWLDMYSLGIDICRDWLLTYIWKQNLKVREAMAKSACDNRGKGCTCRELYFHQHMGKAVYFWGARNSPHGRNLELGHLIRDVP